MATYNRKTGIKMQSRGAIAIRATSSRVAKEMKAEPKNQRAKAIMRMTTQVQKKSEAC